ncbi:hypothetical protein [Mesoterricola sediminis]|uniref:Uncharacterized protein n=1 Tax=Mesoterricola sediminis TaxID=2927980 RepID=A0AA48KE09_9BACT|nr:hypothetical protein [Mesoterricola sediminis]BDU78771.1 hypothetical protein METESE_37290 [Mesoterricola sediminis]
MLGPSLSLLLAAVPAGPAGVPAPDPADLRLHPAVILVQDPRGAGGWEAADDLSVDQEAPVVPLRKASVLSAPEPIKEH